MIVFNIKNSDNPNYKAISYFDTSSNKSIREMETVCINPDHITDIQPAQDNSNGTIITMDTQWRAFFIPMSFDKIAGLFS